MPVMQVQVDREGAAYLAVYAPGFVWEYGYELRPTFSADGRRVAFTRPPRGLWVADVVTSR